MGEQTNRLVARSLWEAIAGADVPRLRSLLSEKCVWRMHGTSPLAGCYVGADEILPFMARVGELTSDLRSDLIDVFASDAGAVLRYRVRAQRGFQKLDTEQLFLIQIEDGRITQGVFAPFDQARYDRFFAPQ